VNSLTLKIYDEKIEKEFDEHVNSAQYQTSTFVVYLIGAIVSVAIQANNLKQGKGSIF
jgi:hypothetical protein